MTKEKEEENQDAEKKGFEERTLGGGETKEKKKTLKLQEDCLFGLLAKNRNQIDQDQTPKQKQKVKGLKHLLRLEQRPTIFSTCSVLVQLVPFLSAIAVFG